MMDDLFRLILILHIAAGSSSLIVFWIPLFVKKGGDIHIKIGKAYVFLMWIVVITSVLLSMINLINGMVMIAAFLGFLSVITAHPLWYGMTILKHKKEIPVHVKRISLILNSILFVGGLGLLLWSLLLNVQGRAILLMIFGLIGILSGGPRIFRRKKSVSWLAEHIGGLLGSGIAAYTAFFAFGGSRFFGHIFIDQWIIIPWILPTVIGTISIMFWTKKMARPQKVIQIKSSISLAENV